MAGWSILGNGSALDYLEILQNLQKSGFCLDFDVNSFGMNKNDGSSDAGGVKDNKLLRDIFDQILSVFLKEVSARESIKPLPAMLGDGKSVDLFKLFWVVREKGGYDFVSKNGFWGLVSQEIGLDLGVASSVKLFYFKYLDVLDRWIQSFFKDKGRGGGVGVGECDRNLGLLPEGLKTQFKEFLCTVSDHSRVNDNQVSSSRNLHNTHQVTCRTELGGAVKRVDNDENGVVLNKSVVKQEVYSHKRKRETLSGMLIWLTEIAKKPNGAAISKLGEHYMQKEFWKLNLLTRNALVQNQNNRWTEEKDNPLWQKKQKMHPSMYEDQMAVDNLSMERLRGSPRFLSQRNCQFDPYYDSSELDTSAIFSAGIENDYCLNPFDDGLFRKRVSIGSLYQAEVPEWTGVALDSDPKWLGTLHWPLVAGEQNSLVETDPIGKGRHDSCNCRLPGSVECVRFHIAEKKVILKSELGMVFYTWRFHFMGEEVSLSWTEEEEKKFKATVRLNPPSLDKNFWDQLCRCFRSKSWKSLVSYYFNVFVLQRRAYQNRVTPSKVDSDDDESEFGSLSKGFGHEAVKVPGFRSIACVQNYQHTELD